MRREGRPEAIFGHHHARPRAGDELRDAVWRIRRVERQVRTAGLEDAEQAHHQGSRPGHAEPHDRLGADTLPLEAARQTGRPGVQLAERP